MAVLANGRVRTRRFEGDGEHIVAPELRPLEAVVAVPEKAHEGVARAFERTSPHGLRRDALVGLAATRIPADLPRPVAALEDGQCRAALPELPGRRRRVIVPRHLDRLLARDHAPRHRVGAADVPKRLREPREFVPEEVQFQVVPREPTDDLVGLHHALPATHRTDAHDGRAPEVDPVAVVEREVPLVVARLEALEHGRPRNVGRDRREFHVALDRALLVTVDRLLCDRDDVRLAHPILHRREREVADLRGVAADLGRVLAHRDVVTRELVELGEARRVDAPRAQRDRERLALTVEHRPVRGPGALLRRVEHQRTARDEARHIGAPEVARVVRAEIEGEAVGEIERELAEAVCSL